jgi:hypothetical protein
LFDLVDAEVHYDVETADATPGVTHPSPTPDSVASVSDPVPVEPPKPASTSKPSSTHSTHARAKAKGK